MLCQTRAENVTITCNFRHGYPPEKIDISEPQKKEDVTRMCVGANRVTLEGSSTLNLDGVSYTQGFMDWLFHIRELEMCVLVENGEDFRALLIYTVSVVGKCKGPKVSIVNNTNLRTITIKSDKFGQKMASVAIRIRGNRKLRASDLRELEELRKQVNGNWDLQPVGECTLPKPFGSFEMLDQSCTDFYGPLVLQEGVKKLHYDLSKVHKFNLEGCIQIQKTELKDISFLMAFSRFRRMRYCDQFIRDNKNLCSRNLRYLNVFFEDIQFSNNTDQPCDECIGGFVSEQYLRESVNCSTVYGDLVIANFRGLPSNFENLRGIKAIEGRLIITNNTGLHKFDYFFSLEKVGRKYDDVAVIIEDNGDLYSLEIPSILDNQLKKEETRVKIVNNPMLFRDIEKASQTSTAVEDTNTIGEKYEENSTALKDSEMIGSHSDENSSNHIMSIRSKTGVVAVVSLVLFCNTVIFFICRQKASVVRNPQSHYGTRATTKKEASSCTITSQSALRSTSVSLCVDPSSKTTSTSSTTEQARKSSQVSRIQYK